MKKNKLYTVNKWNQPYFMPNDKNLFLPGGSLGGFLGGIGDKIGGVMGGGKLAGSPVGGLVGSLGSAVGGLAGNAISGGLESGAGNAIGSIGGTVGGALSSVNPVLGGIVSAGSGIIGGLVNAAFGTAVDQEKLNKAKEGTAALNNFRSEASTFADIQGPMSQENVQDAYRGGWFSSGDAEKKNAELRYLREEAKNQAYLQVANNARNIADDQLGNALANYSAFGGKLGYPKKRAFANGGLEASFFDGFGKDPIGAAVRYNQGLEALAVEREAREAEASREAEYADMQKRLLQLETSNQGLQALVAAQSVPAIPTTSEIVEEPTKSSSSTPSVAATKLGSRKSNWDYIEDQLKRSGKFNDVQIKGIKYNLQRESGIGEYDGGDSGTARGLAQWRGSRIPKDMSLEGQTKHLIETLSNFDGKEHWIGRKNYEGFLNARTPEEAHYYIAKGYERPASDILKKVKNDSDMSLKNIGAFGGELGTNGTDFTNGLLYIDEGGSHEENPLEGVPMGLDPQGIPNLVEEGETVYNDYVFSDRMKVPFFMYKELGLGGVMKKKGKEMSFADASKKLAQESEQRPNDPISQAGLDASLARLAEVQEAERMRKQGKEYMGLEEYACGGKLGNKYKRGGSSNHSYGDTETPTYSLPQNNYEADYPWLFGDIPTTAKPPLSPMEQIARDKSTPSSTVSITDNGTNFRKTPILASEDRGISDNGLGSSTPIEGEEGVPTYPTWMRYAPVFGTGAMALTDALGLTNKPDYTYADKLEAAANRAGYAPNINYKPVGDYLVYRPMDIWFEQNRMDANARATDRAIMNSTSPSRMAGLLASGYNNQIANGNLYRQALEYNDAKRERVADFNRRTNMFNSQMGLEAAMANARYQQAARQMGLSGLVQAAVLRDSIDARVGAARSANLTNFLNNLGNIGRENFAMNQINTDRSRNYYGKLNGDVIGYKRKKSCGGKLNRK